MKTKDTLYEVFVGDGIIGIPKPKKKKSSWNRIKIDRADQLFSLYIRTRDKWTCKRCLQPYEVGDQRLQNSHFYGRRSEATRFYPDNCDALCFGCHRYFTSNGFEYGEWKQKQLGKRRFATLVLQANSYKKKDRKMEVIIWKKALEDLSNA